MCIYICIYNIYIYIYITYIYIYVCIYMCVCVCFCVCIYIYIMYSLYKWSEVIHDNRVLKSYRSKMGIYTSCSQVYELPQSHCGDNQEGILFS